VFLIKEARLGVNDGEDPHLLVAHFEWDANGRFCPAAFQGVVRTPRPAVILAGVRNNDGQPVPHDHPLTAVKGIFERFSGWIEDPVPDDDGGIQWLSHGCPATIRVPRSPPNFPTERERMRGKTVPRSMVAASSRLIW